MAEVDQVPAMIVEAAAFDDDIAMVVATGDNNDQTALNDESINTEVEIDDSFNDESVNTAINESFNEETDVDDSFNTEVDTDIDDSFNAVEQDDDGVVDL